MKHKYVLSKSNNNSELLIREYAELSKDIFSPVCESFYDIKQFDGIMTSGQEAIMETMRTRNFYPPGGFTEKLAIGLSDLLSSKDQDKIEVYCDDTEFLTTSLNGQDTLEKINGEEDDSLENFIEDELPNGFDNNVKSNNVSASVDIEEDTLDDADE